MEKKKGIFSWYFESNLLYRILIGLVLGGILGILLATSLSGETLAKVLVWTGFFGNIFVRLLNMIILPIIISTLIVGASSVSPAQLGKVGVRVIIFYLVTSAVAVIIGLVMGTIFHPHAVLSNFAEVAGREATKTKMTDILLNIIPTNIFAAIVNVQVLPIIFFVLVFGLALSYLRISSNSRVKNAADLVFNFFDGVAEVVMKIIKGVMQYAPIGVFCLIFGVFAQNGPKVVGALGIVTAACFIGYALHVVLVYFGLLRFYGGMKVGRFIRDGKDPFITAFVTRSSNGTLPVTMEAAENMGIKKDVYSFSLPLGATINMDGTAIYLGVSAIFIALTVWGHNFSIGQMGQIVLLATVASIGTAGVPGAGAIMLLMVLESVGLPVTAGTAVAGAYAMILGIDALLDMGRTALNVTGDLVCTTIVAKKMGDLDMNKWNS